MCRSNTHPCKHKHPCVPLLSALSHLQPFFTELPPPPWAWSCLRVLPQKEKKRKYTSTASLSDRMADWALEFWVTFSTPPRHITSYLLTSLLTHLAFFPLILSSFPHHPHWLYPLHLSCPTFIFLVYFSCTRTSLTGLWRHKRWSRKKMERQPADFLPAAVHVFIVNKSG